MPLPNVVIIGAQKAGTTSLHAYLGQHPDASMSEPKELNFFNWYWERGPEWYASHFADAALRGEACPQYTAGWPHVVERMHELLPHARLIYLVRDPIARSIAEWRHTYAKGVESRPLEMLVHLPWFAESSYIRQSRYAERLEEYLQYFPQEQILVAEQSEMRVNRVSQLRRIYSFCDIDPEFAEHAIPVELNVSSTRVRAPAAARFVLGFAGGWHRPASRWKVAVAHRLTHRWGQPVPPTTLASEVNSQLAALVADDAQRLRALTGESFANWSV